MARQVRNVYADTLDAEMEHVRALAERYKYVALDAEFPGVVVRPIGSFGSVGDFNYQVRGLVGVPGEAKGSASTSPTPGHPA